MVIRVDMETLFADICKIKEPTVKGQGYTPRQVSQRLQHAIITTRGTHLVAIVPNQVKDKASVHERHQVVKEKRQINVHLFSLLQFLSSNS